MCHQKYHFFDERMKILDFSKIDPELKITSKINDFRQKSNACKQILYMVRSTLPHHHH